jgi:hypothetical protein
MFYLSSPFCRFRHGGCALDPRSWAFADWDLHEIWDRVKIHTIMAGEGAAAMITPGLRQMRRVGKPRGSQGLLGPDRPRLGRSRSSARAPQARGGPPSRALGTPRASSLRATPRGSRPRAELGPLVPHAVLVRHFMKYAAPGRRPGSGTGGRNVPSARHSGARAVPGPLPFDSRGPDAAEPWASRPLRRTG